MWDLQLGSKSIGLSVVFEYLDIISLADLHCLCTGEVTSKAMRVE